MGAVRQRRWIETLVIDSGVRRRTDQPHAVCEASRGRCRGFIRPWRESPPVAISTPRAEPRAGRKPAPLGPSPEKTRTVLLSAFFRPLPNNMGEVRQRPWVEILTIGSEPRRRTDQPHAVCEASRGRCCGFIRPWRESPPVAISTPRDGPRAGRKPSPLGPSPEKMRTVLLSVFFRPLPNNMGEVRQRPWVEILTIGSEPRRRTDQPHAVCEASRGRCCGFIRPSRNVAARGESRRRWRSLPISTVTSSTRRAPPARARGGCRACARPPAGGSRRP